MVYQRYSRLTYVCGRQPNVSAGHTCNGKPGFSGIRRVNIGVGINCPSGRINGVRSVIGFRGRTYRRRNINRHRRNLKCRRSIRSVDGIVVGTFYGGRICTSIFRNRRSRSAAGGSPRISYGEITRTWHVIREKRVDKCVDPVRRNVFRIGYICRVDRCRCRLFCRVIYGSGRRANPYLNKITAYRVGGLSGGNYILYCDFDTA